MPHPLTPLQEQKASLRAEMRARREVVREENRNTFKMLADLFLAHVQVEAGAVISSYQAFRDEMDPTLLVAALRERGCKIALPVIIGKTQPLSFRLYQPGDPLIAHVMGFLEPDPAASPAVDPDILLVPLLAFDRQRNRLGYGAGYYDRTISELRARKPINAVGIGYSWQEVAEVPVGPHDARLDKVVTEINVF